MAQPSIDTGTKQVGNGAGVTPVGFGYYPPEGSRVCNVSYNWNALTFYREDLSVLKSLGFQTTIQSVFVDNSLNPNTVTIQVDSTEQVLVVPPYSQGIFPIFFGENAGYWISSSGNANIATKLIHLNVPANTAGVWSVNPPGSAFDSNQNIFSPLIATKAYSNLISAAGNNYLILQNANAYPFMTAIKVSIAANSTLSVAGNVTINIYGGITTVFSDTVYVPSAAITSETPLLLYSLSGFCFIGSSLNTGIGVNLSTSFATGGVNVTVFGGYTTQSP